MSYSKRLVRLTAWLLALCLCIMPIYAQNTDENPQTVETQEVATEASHRLASLVRRSPYYSAIAIGCLEDGTKITVISATQEFYRIDCYEMTGYISKSQVVQDANGEYYVNCAEDSLETKPLPTYSAQDALSIKGLVRSTSMQYTGVPYVLGGTTPRGFDCSGLTQFVFDKVGIQLNRTVATQLENGIIISKEDLQCGDLVFFQNTTGWGHFASHIGIYIGNGQMIHSGNSGVMVVNLSDAYYTNHFLCARRVVLSQLPQEELVPAFGISGNINSSYWRESSQTQLSGNFFHGALASA